MIVNSMPIDEDFPDMEATQPRHVRQCPMEAIRNALGFGNNSNRTQTERQQQQG
jgi:hypothetical protein